MRWKQSTALVLAAGILSGCVTMDEELFAMRYGPSPLLTDVARNNPVDQATAIRIVLTGGAVLVHPVTGERLSPIVLPAYGAREQWFNIIWEGFNKIDEACSAYITDLWKLERRKTRNSTILHAAGAATAAILSAQVTPQTAAALLVISQAFGLAGVLNNAIADTYLYTQSAANVYQLVRVTTEAYRDDLAKNFVPEKPSAAFPDEVAYPMGSVGAAYFHLREYLSLCLPPAIQGQVDKLVAGAKAAPAGSAEERSAKGQKVVGGPVTAAALGVRPRPAPRTTARPSVF